MNNNPDGTSNAVDVDIVVSSVIPAVIVVLGLVDCVFVFFACSCCSFVVSCQHYSI